MGKQRGLDFRPLGCPDGAACVVPTAEDDNRLRVAAPDTSRDPVHPAAVPVPVLVGEIDLYSSPRHIGNDNLPAIRQFRKLRTFVSRNSRHNLRRAQFIPENH